MFPDSAPKRREKEQPDRFRRPACNSGTGMFRADGYRYPENCGPGPVHEKGQTPRICERLWKIVDTGETAALSDLRKLLIGAADQLVGFADLEKVDIFADGEAGGAFENLAEIIFGVAEMVCQLVQRNVLTVVLREIIGDLPLQTGQLCDPLLQRVIEGDVCGHGRAVTKVKVQGLLKEKGGHRLGIRSAGGPFPPHVLLQLPKGAVRDPDQRRHIQDRLIQVIVTDVEFGVDDAELSIGYGIELMDLIGPDDETILLCRTRSFPSRKKAPSPARQKYI